jgi:hypothetical protein
MKLSKLKTLTVAAIFATILALGAAIASAAVCPVPSMTYPTIQSAVDDSTCAEIDVGAGTYNENLTIPRAVTLVGPNATVDPNTGSRGAEATINGGSGTAIIPQAPGIVIKGFTVATTASGFPIYTGGTDITGLTISYDIIGSGVRAITIATSPSNDLSILHNRISGSGYGIAFGNGIYGNVKINNNVVNGPNIYYAIFINGNGTITGFELKDNNIHDVANIAANTSNGTVSGNTFDAPFDAFLDMQIDLHNSTITGNTFEGHNTSLAGDNNACLQLYGSQYGEVPSDHVTVSGNAFNNCGSASEGAYAIQLSPDIHHITITGNMISNSYDGVNTRPVTDGNGTPIGVWDVTGKEIHINGNNITGSTRYGVNNTQVGILDAECNWWNSASGPGPVGPGTGDKVSTNVDFTPWLISPAPDGICAATRKGCQQAVEQQEKDFNDMQKAQKKSFDATHPTAAQRKAFEANQKAAKDNFQMQYKANEEQCKQLPK